MTAFSRQTEVESAFSSTESWTSPVWARAVPAADFRQMDPQNGAPATEPYRGPHRVRQGHAVHGRDLLSTPSLTSGWGFQRGRDGGLGSDDRFQWTIDTFLDGRTGYFFEMNPSGLMADALQGRQQRQQSPVGRHLGRACAEQRDRLDARESPFRSVRSTSTPIGDTWGINFSVPSGGKTKKACGWDGRGIRDFAAWRMPAD
jgi:hypothetical protein